MNACREHELSISLRAAGALGPAEAARLEGHLASCGACRAEAAAAADLLSLARLPPVSEAERRALADLPERALAELRRAERRRLSRRRLSAGLALAAAAAVAVLAPVLLRDALDRGPGLQGPAAAAPSAAALAAWQEPDLDRLWEDSAVIDLESAVAATGGFEAVLPAGGSAASYAAVEAAAQY